MRTVTMRTDRHDQVVDITEVAQSVVDEAERAEGVCVVFAAHTTCAVTTADLDPGTDLDLLDALRHLLPQLRYRHPHDPAHAPDHLLSSLLGPSVAVPYSNRRLLLGTWQRIILVELSGPRARTVHITTA